MDLERQIDLVRRLNSWAASRDIDCVDTEGMVLMADGWPKPSVAMAVPAMEKQALKICRLCGSRDVKGRQRTCRKCLDGTGRRAARELPLCD